MASLEEVGEANCDTEAAESENTFNFDEMNEETDVDDMLDI